MPKLFNCSSLMLTPLGLPFRCLLKSLTP